jgi:hypothetical protein
MGAKKKFKDDYPSDKEEPKANPEQNLEDKRLIEAYQKKISELLQDDPNMQKKAALIISQLINSSKK